MPTAAVDIQPVRDITQPEPGSDAGANTATVTTFLSFRVGEHRLCLDIRRIREVTRGLPVQVPLEAAGGVVGMTTLRGDSAVVVDLARVMQVASSVRPDNGRLLAVRHADNMVCLLVDHVDGLLDIPCDELQPPPALISDMETPWLEAVTRTPAGDLLGVVALSRILSLIAPAIPQESATDV